MKNKFSIILIFSIISILFASCSSSKKVNCDAYGSVQKIENSDLATK